MEYFGNLFLRPVEDGEQEPGDPRDEIDMKNYLFSSKGAFSYINGNIFFAEVKLPKEP